MYKKAHFGVLERTVKLTNIYALENKYYIKIFSMLFVLPPNESNSFSVFHTKVLKLAYKVGTTFTANF